MFRRILIANRGEIALRILRSCRELGIETVAIYSEADRDSLHVRLADQAVCVGPGPSAQSYLNIPNILSAAVLTEVDAIHPGYGYLAEQAHFADMCATHGIKFIGPSVETIERMGDKAVAKKMMQEAGVPVVPGSDQAVDSVEEALALADDIGYPIMLKAAAGGGGKGMRLVADRDELRRAWPVARGEAQAAFGDDRLYMERYIESPRHIEIQILADEHGNVIHLGERECSIQRRHQKLIEEAPSPFIDAALRRRMGEAAVRGAKAVGYYNAGTMEFLVDSSGNFYFMEMNTRIQVEHPVTELVTGVDIVKEQILIAAGEPLRYSQGDIRWQGHAIECRINAEDPQNDFRPSPGTITFYHPPGGPGIRVDSAAYTGLQVPPYYDSLIAKVIAYGADRDEAIRRMQGALDELTIEGIKTNIDFHRAVMANERFRRGEVATDFLAKYMQELVVATPEG